MMYKKHYALRVLCVVYLWSTVRSSHATETNRMRKKFLKCKKILRLRSFIKTDHKIFVVSLMYFCENSSENSCGSVRYLINLFSSFSWKQNKNKTELTTLPSSLLRILVETPPSHLSSFYPGWRQCCIVFFLLGSSVRK